MPKNNHLGIRKKRKAFTESFKLEHFLILTDTKETEKNYFNGLRDSLPFSIRDKITIKVIPNIKTKDLISRALDEQARSPQYQNVWIVFDKDEVVEFDEIIRIAHRRGLKTGWSNPCFEIWLESYFGAIHIYKNSKECCDDFAKIFKKYVKKDYAKNTKSIYQDLVLNGDENLAIRMSKRKFDDANNSCNEPSRMDSCTTVFELVDAIRKNNKG